MYIFLCLETCVGTAMCAYVLLYLCVCRLCLWLKDVEVLDCEASVGI